MPGEVLAVVDRLYRAVAEPSAWRAALGGVADLLGSDHALLWVGRGPTSDCLLSARVDHDEFARRQTDYETQWPAINDWLPAGTITRVELIDDRSYERDVHYNEVIRHVGGFHALFARVAEPGPAYRLAACRRRSRGNFRSDATARLRLLMPHVANAVMLRLRLGLAGSEAAALRSLVDRLSSAVLFTDAAAEPLHVNPAAERLLEESGGLHLRGDGLAAATADATRRLREAIAVHAAGGAAGPSTVCLPGADGALPLLATVLPLARLDIALPGIAAPLAAVVVTRPERPGAIDRRALAELFGLTPRETDVAVLVAAGLSPEKIAARLRLGRGTVASHLKRAFLKTDTHAQAGLAVLIGRFARPVE